MINLIVFTGMACGGHDIFCHPLVFLFSLSKVRRYNVPFGKSIFT